jgi:diguanylate cyclase (GGDEF)-like protein/PAS domain S-box-containing protein/putative nucleotidyltransferase with HDIG domain
MRVGGERSFTGIVRDLTERVRAEEALRRERDYAAALIASMQDAVAVISPEGVLLEISPRFVEMTGFRREELVGSRPPFPYWPEDRRPAMAAALDTLLETGEGEFDLEFRRRDGSRFPVILAAAPLRDAAGRITGYVETVKDVTERRRAADALRVERDAQAALRVVATAVAAEAEPAEIFGLVAEEAARVLRADAGMVLRLDAGGAVVVGAHGVADPWTGSDAPRRLPAAGGILEVLRSGRRPARVDAPPGSEPLREVLGRGAPASIAAVPVEAAGGLWGAVVVAGTVRGALPEGAEERLASFAELVGVAISNADARALLAARATTDQLTGLPNQATFHERLATEVDRARRHRHPLSLILFDLDHFKRVNDRHGHQAGDRALQELARRISRLTRAEDVLARVGGEEFAWILPETDAVGAWRASERARRAVASEPFGGIGPLTLSAGICDLERAGSPGELFRLADVALYWAKAQGRDASVRYAPEVVEVLSADARAAEIERGQKLGSIRVLARAVDAKDPSTQAHSGRVAELAARLAGRLGWPAERVALLREAGLVHDVGKIGVPDAVLFKRGRLGDAEIRRIRAHAELGAEIVAEALSPEQTAWVRHHHERIDGMGYPDGMAGPDIPEGARILALADAWDAMTAVRLYRPARDHDDAIAECRRERGRQFWSRAVDALEELAGEGRLELAENELEDDPAGVGR